MRAGSLDHLNIHVPILNNTRQVKNQVSPILRIWPLYNAMVKSLKILENFLIFKRTNNFRCTNYFFLKCNFLARKWSLTEFDYNQNINIKTLFQDLSTYFIMHMNVLLSYRVGISEDVLFLYEELRTHFAERRKGIQKTGAISFSPLSPSQCCHNAFAHKCLIVTKFNWRGYTEHIQKPLVEIAYKYYIM